MSNSIEVFEDSPNGYKITVNEPNNTEAAIKYYKKQFDLFERQRHPAEYSIICYSVAKVLYADRTDKTKLHDQDDRAKRIENALYYLTQALEYFTVKNYPIMFAIINIFMAKLFRERSLLFSKRTFLHARGTPEESLMYGVDAAMEALPILAISKPHAVEHAICCLELGFLYVLHSEYPANSEDTSLREQGITYLDRVLGIVEETPSSILFVGAKGKTTRWSPEDSNSFPSHIASLLEGHPYYFLEGCSYYLMGRMEQGWGLVTYVELHEKASVETIASNPHITNAFNHFTTCTSTSKKALPSDSLLWADAHHRTALMVIKYPELVDPEFFRNRANLFLESAIAHFHQGLKCSVLSKTERMDMHFHLSQTYIMKLQSIIDRVPPQGSVTKAIVESDGIDLIDNIEHHLKEALKRVTAANNQSVQDAYLYFYSTLKMAEYRMLQAACAPPSHPINREQNMHDALAYIIDACIARSLPDNIDLHYIATNQLAQVMLAVKRTHGASKAYAKVLLCLSVLINRASFNPVAYEPKLRDDALKHASQAILAASKDTNWIKLHLGPQLLHERAAAGYASWSFEDVPTSKKKRQNSEDYFAKLTPNDSDRLLIEPGKPDPYRVMKPQPPKGVPPLALPGISGNTKKVYISGEDMPAAAFDNNSQEEKKKPTVNEFKPPPGPVPLSALGHSIPDDITKDDHIYQHTHHRQSPYTHRLRIKVPPMSEAMAIDRANRVAYSLGKGRVAYLLPKHNNEPVVPAPIAEEDEEEDDDDDDEGKEEEEDEEIDENDIDEEQEQEQETNFDEEKVPDTTTEPSAASQQADNNDNEGETIITRPRSQKVRFQDPSLQPISDDHEENHYNNNDNNNNNKHSFFTTWNIFNKHPKTLPESQQPNQQQPNQQLLSKKEKKKTLWTSIFGKNKKKKHHSKHTTKLPQNLSNHVGLWASKQAFYVFMVHSRLSRMQLIMRSKKLQVLDGSRVSSVLFYAKSKYLQYFYRFRTRLLNDCTKLTTPPNSLKELSQFSFSELSILFRSHAKLAQRLDDLEHFLLYKISKMDYFLPMIMIVPSFSRDIASLDDSLLNADLLMSNISFEKELAQSKLESSNKHTAVLTLMQKIKADERIQQKAAMRSVQHDYSKSSRAHTAINNMANHKYSATKDAKEAAQKLIKNSAERLQELEEREDILAGKMSYALSQQLDGCGYLRDGQQGFKDMLIKHLAHDECMLLWHVPIIPSQKVSCLLIWRENSENKHEFYSSQHAVQSRISAALKKKATNGQRSSSSSSSSSDDNEDNPRKRHMTGIIMEFAQCDLEASHLNQHIQIYLEALHATPFARRTTLANDALRSLSCALSITELLLMIPTRCRSLLICCPSLMRLIPWHALLIEINQPKPATTSLDHKNDEHKDNIIETHLCDRYVVRVAPTLSIFELVSTAQSHHRNSVGLHRLCAIDGDDRARAMHISTNKTTNYNSSIGIRAADLEVACVSHTWSADPEDYHILADDAAAAYNLETGLFSDDNLEKFKKFRDEIRLNETEEDQIARLHREEVRQRREEHQLLHKRFQKLISSKFNHHADQKPNEEEEEEDDDEDEDDGQESEEHKFNSYWLTLSRVVHIAAHRAPMIDRGIGNNHDDAALLLPSIIDPRNPSHEAGRLTATEVIQQLYMKNCALAVLSRFAITDDVYKTTSTVIESHCEFLDAMHMSGPCTLLYPLWDGAGGQGVASLARMLFLIRFYSMLPAKSRDRVSVAETTRRAQLWLRDVTANDAIAFIAKAPLPQKARETVIAEMEAYCAASIAEKTEATPDKKQQPKEGNRKGGNRKFFTHFLSWACFAVSGHGGGVHHPDLTLDGEDEFGGDGNTNTHNNGEDDVDIKDMVYEADVLRLEDRLDEARELEEKIRRLRRYRAKKRLDAIKYAGWKAGRGMMDTLDYLDKTLLDQDSDEVSVSSEDSNDNDDGLARDIASLASSSLAAGGGRNNNYSLKVKPGMAKERDVAFEQWKSRVGGLNMEVKAPELKPQRNKNISPMKKDNYEFNMMQSAKTIGSGGRPYGGRAAGGSSSMGESSSVVSGTSLFGKEDDDDDDADNEEDDDGTTASKARGSKGKKMHRSSGNDNGDGDEGEDEYEGDGDPLARYKKHRKKKKKKGLFAEITGGVRSYGEIVQLISEQPDRIVREHKDQCIIC